MSSPAASKVSPALEPEIWIDLLTAHTVKGDMFSARTLMTVLEGVEKLKEARNDPARHFTVSGYHTTLFERLRHSFNNPALLKEIGLIYLGEIRLPGIALKHFDLARQFAPKDRDIGELQRAATLALARQTSDLASHSVIDEVSPSKPEVGKLIRSTTRIDVDELRQHLDASTEELGRKQQLFRKTGLLQPQMVPQVKVADFDPFLKEAQRAIGQTDFVRAADALVDAQAAGAPVEELQAYYAQLGLTAFDHGRMEEALHAFLVTRDLGPEEVEGWFNCGLVYQRTGQLEHALGCYLEATRLAPDNPRTWCNLGSVHFESGNFDEAEQAARRAIEIKPDYARAWDNLAATLSAVNRLPEAAQACQKAIHFQPDLYSAWFKLGVINFQQENFVAAQEAFNLTGENPDFFPHVLYYFSMIEARRGDIDQALQKLEQARFADASNELEFSALKEIAAACAKLGKYVTAADFYGQILAKRPDDFSAWLAMGTAYHRAEQIDRAHDAYRRATELQPDNPLPWHNLGLLASELGNHEESRECFQHEVDLCPDDPKAWYDLAVSLQSLDREEESSEAFEHAEKLVKSKARRSSDLSAALSIVRRLNLGDRVLKTE